MIRRILAVVAILEGMSAFGVTADKTWVERTFARSNLTVRVEALENAPYCTIAAAQAMTNAAMDKVRGNFLPATPPENNYGPYFIDRSLLVGAYSQFGSGLGVTGALRVFGGWESITANETPQTLPEYLTEREASLSNNLATANAALSEAAIRFSSWLMQFKWDADEEICYRSKVANGYGYDYAVTNIDLTAVTNWPALRAYMEEHEND